jgi:hypothetical protein
MRKNGDSILTLKGEDDIVATTDFSTQYIRDKKYGRFNIKKNQVLVFSWTNDRFINLDVENIKMIKPLASLLMNVRDQEPRGINDGR